jgi:hypothetical protein
MQLKNFCGRLLLVLTVSAVAPTAMAGGSIYLKGSPWVGLADDEQTFLSQNRKLDTSASSAGGLALEWRFANGFAVGAEFISYTHDYTPPPHIEPFFPRSGEAVVNATSLTFKKYFGEAGKVFYPYVGLGIGKSNIETSHPLFGAPPVYNYVSDEYHVNAYQISAGMEVRFFPTKKRHLGVIVEVKHLGYDAIGANRYDPTAMAVFLGVGLVRD